jgi:hypothetical protein
MAMWRQQGSKSSTFGLPCSYFILHYTGVVTGLQLELSIHVQSFVTLPLNGVEALCDRLSDLACNSISLVFFLLVYKLLFKMIVLTS